MHLALYQPDIPQNLGGAIRLCACLGVELHVIEPCGFLLNDKKIRRVAMDYAKSVDYTRHTSWEAFMEWKHSNDARLLLLTTKSAEPYTAFAFQRGDMLLLGRESAGVPEEVHNAADARLIIPMAKGARSLNVVAAGALVLGEALRQTAC